MAYDITKKRATETAEIELVDGDGAPLNDDKGERLSVTVHGPGSKVWQQADADRNRKRAARLEKNGGKVSRVIDGAHGDEVDFLCRVTISFNGWTYPAPGDTPWPSNEAMFRAAYGDDTLGFIRDHVHREVHQWSAFTQGSASS